MSADHLIAKLNEALGWELRAINMYAHYAAYIRGIHRLQLEPHFTAEANESMVHSNIVRSAIVKLGGVAVTERNVTPIEHVSSYLDMLAESLKTETKAAEVYGELMTIIEEAGMRISTMQSNKSILQKSEVSKNCDDWLNDQTRMLSIRSSARRDPSCTSFETEI